VLKSATSGWVAEECGLGVLVGGGLLMAVLFGCGGFTVGGVLVAGALGVDGLIGVRLGCGGFTVGGVLGGGAIGSGTLSVGLVRETVGCISLGVVGCAVVRPPFLLKSKMIPIPMANRLPPMVKNWVVGFSVFFGGCGVMLLGEYRDAGGKCGCFR
jgi:hypothetical protein